MAKEIAYKVTVDTSEVDSNVEKTTDNVEYLGKAANKTSNEMKSGFKAAEQGGKKLGTSISGIIKSLGLIGAALAVFEFMRDLLTKNQKVMDALNTATTALEILFYKLFESLEPIGNAMKAAFDDPIQSIKNLGEAIWENLMNRFEAVALQAQALTRIFRGLTDLDWDEVTEGAKDFGSAVVQVVTGLDKAQQTAALDGIKNFANDISNATKASIAQADALVQLRKEVELAEVEQRKLMLQYQNEAEIQRQIRDDISRTIEERQAANQRLGEILDEQIQKETAMAEKRLQLANAEIAVAGETTELLRQRAEAELELIDLQERITGQRSEQLTNQIALERELKDLQNEIRLEKLTEQEKEVEEFIQHAERMNELAELAGENEVFTEEEITSKIQAIREKYLQKKIQSEHDAAEKAKAIAEAETNERIALAFKLANGISGIVTGLAGQSKAAVAIQKTIAIAQIAVDTARSLSSAIAAATSAAAATGPGAVVATPVFIATQIATVLAAVGQAVAVLNSAGGGGSATVPSVNTSGIAAASAPQINPVTTNTTELGNTEQAELAPIQAFVVETQLTNTQNEVGQIEGQAEFGG